VALAGHGGDVEGVGGTLGELGDGEDAGLVAVEAVPGGAVVGAVVELSIEKSSCVSGTMVMPTWVGSGCENWKGAGTDAGAETTGVGAEGMDALGACAARASSWTISSRKGVKALCLKRRSMNARERAFSSARARF